MTADPERVPPAHYREGKMTTAAFEARARHDRCDDVSIHGSTIDGEEVLYCANCGQILLRWG